MGDDEKDYSDDGSFEFVNYEEYLSRNDDDNDDDDRFTTGSGSDRSYELVVASEEVVDDAPPDREACNRSTDYYEEVEEDVSEREAWNRSTDSSQEEEEEEEDVYEDLEYEPGSTSFLEVDACFDMYGRFCFETVAYQTTDILIKFPEHVKKREHMDINDIVKENILPCLPAKALARFKLVSTDWKARITSPFLAHQQSYRFKRLSGFFQDLYGSITCISLDKTAYGVPWMRGRGGLDFLPEPVSIKSSCNGLLLCRGESVYYVCNPVNWEYHTLPSPTYYHGDSPKVVLIFEPSCLNFESRYQVICAFSLPLCEGGAVVMFDIYHSSTKAWRLSEMDCIDLASSQLVDYTGYYMNGVAYWETSGRELLAFDVKNEIYSTIPLPSGGWSLQGAVSQMDGELCYVEASCEEDKCRVDIYGGSLMSRKCSMVIDDLPEEERNECPRLVRILPLCVDNANFLPILKGGCLSMYNIDERKVECSMKIADYSATGKYFPYVNSLVSLPREEAVLLVS